jgi:hypothetical protein
MDSKTLRTLALGVAAIAVIALGATIHAAPAGAASETSATVSVPSTPPARWVGVYQPGAPQDISALETVEGQIGTHIEVANFFRSCEQKFTDREVDAATQHGTIPLISLEMCAYMQGADLSQPAWTLASFTNGKHDALLKAYADEARDSGHEVWIRPFHEMNGNWYPWCGTTNGNSPSQFVGAWRHVRQIFRNEGADNVKFVWCPNVESLDSSWSLTNPKNAISVYYPGDDYVDYMALDGYNFSTTIPAVHWRSFADLFAKPYAELTRLSATKPIFIAETASVSVGGDKPGWIGDMFRAIPQQFPRIIGVSWYNSGNSRQDWPINSSSASLMAFRNGLANGYFAPGIELAPARTSLSVKLSAKSGLRKRSVKIYGSLMPGQYHDAVRVDVQRVGGRLSHRVVYTNRAASWSLRYTPTVRGTYRITVSYAGDSTRMACVSKTVKYVVK